LSILRKKRKNVAVDSILKALSWGISQLPYLDGIDEEKNPLAKLISDQLWRQCR
jgi:hypothetical protein